MKVRQPVSDRAVLETGFYADLEHECCTYPPLPAEVSYPQLCSTFWRFFQVDILEMNLQEKEPTKQLLKDHNPCVGFFPLSYFGDGGRQQTVFVCFFLFYCLV